MINKIMPKTAIFRNNSLIRNNLQRVSELKNLNTRLVRNENCANDMVIPGGMTEKETFVYKLTGKFPKSVTDRWYETHDYHIDQHLNGSDESVRVTAQDLHNYGYIADDGGHYGDSVDNSDDEGFISKLIGHLFDN